MGEDDGATLGGQPPQLCRCARTSPSPLASAPRTLHRLPRREVARQAGTLSAGMPRANDQISARGARTKARCHMRGWGRVSPSPRTDASRTQYIEVERTGAEAHRRVRPRPVLDVLQLAEELCRRQDGLQAHDLVEEGRLLLAGPGAPSRRRARRRPARSTAGPPARPAPPGCRARSPRLDPSETKARALHARRTTSTAAAPIAIPTGGAGLVTVTTISRGRAPATGARDLVGQSLDETVLAARRHSRGPTSTTRP